MAAPEGIALLDAFLLEQSAGTASAQKRGRGNGGSQVKADEQSAAAEVRKPRGEYAAPKPEQPKPEAVSRKFSSVVAVAVRWLWPGRIARGKVSLIAGHPGLGKSQISLSMAAIVSTGGLWPVDRTRAERGSVVILSAEDDAADTIRPRLEAAGADLDRCHTLDAIRDGFSVDGSERLRGFSLERDLPVLDRLLAKIGDVALLIVDPVSAYLGGADSHKNSDVRALLAPLAELAARHGVAVVAVSHLSKSQVGDALQRVSGSVAFTAAARAAYVVARDQQEKSRRLMLPLKNNLAEDQTGFAFGLEGVDLPGGIRTSRIRWEPQAVDVSAEQALSPEMDHEERNAVEDAAGFLRAILADAPMPAKKVYAEGRGAGYSEATIRRAQKTTGVESYKDGMAGGWFWKLPPKALKNAEDAHVNSVSAFRENERLREPETGQEGASSGGPVEEF